MRKVMIKFLLWLNLCGNGWGANVDAIPVMNFDELKRGLQNR
jgi:hypothetical protein